MYAVYDGISNKLKCYIAPEMFVKFDQANTFAPKVVGKEVQFVVNEACKVGSKGFDVVVVLQQNDFVVKTGVWYNQSTVNKQDSI